MDELTTGESGIHLATVSHDGRFWDVYVDFEHDPTMPDSHRGFLSFAPADGGPEDSVRTATILIEDSDQAVFRKAQGLGDRILVALLRSALPE